MAAIDLTTLAAVRGYLGLLPGPSGAPVVQTSIAAAISAGVQTVTPASMANIAATMVLLIDSGTSAEYVIVTSVSATTFTATFALSHAVTPVPVSDQTDAVLAGMITGASQYWLNRTGRDSLNSAATYNERYDGSGSRRQFLRNTPIQTVTSLKIVMWGGATSIPQSPDGIQPGFVIDQSGKSLAILGSPVGQYPFPCVWNFAEGIQNVLVSYTAGYASTPADVQDKVSQMVAVNYKRRGWIDQASQMLPQAGTVSYRAWEIPPEVERCIQNYTRRALV